jgi:hypothetical protein
VVENESGTFVHEGYERCVVNDMDVVRRVASSVVDGVPRWDSVIFWLGEAVLLCNCCRDTVRLRDGDAT